MKRFSPRKGGGNAGIFVAGFSMFPAMGFVALTQVGFNDKMTAPAIVTILFGLAVIIYILLRNAAIGFGYGIGDEYLYLKRGKHKREIALSDIESAGILEDTGLQIFLSRLAAPIAESQMQLDIRKWWQNSKVYGDIARWVSVVITETETRAGGPLSITKYQLNLSGKVVSLKLKNGELLLVTPARTDKYLDELSARGIPELSGNESLNSIPKPDLNSTPREDAEKGRRRRVILIIPAVLAIVLTAAYLFYTNRPFPDDYGTFISMRNYLNTVLINSGAQEKEINSYFEDYSLDLNPLYSFMFKNSKLSLYLKSYESRLIDTATISQFEIGEGTEDFFDFTFMLRPQEVYSLPFFHGDALKALPGVDGALYMDFYSFDNTADLDNFFGPRIEKIKQAMELAEPYWKTEGFGELTGHLDAYKSPYRFEIIKPEKADEEELKRYFATAYTCFSLYTEAYLASLQVHSGWLYLEEAELNRKNMEDFVGILYEHDVAVKMGKKIFPKEEFDTYFLKGFWGVVE